ncbi:hypothetical protein [Pseudomonas atacamensis]|jgi:hypothetical protein|uniref:hypothetical protein n=1 Tax=Pseudomonas atacamensis TaxID=2565368 RepID=UPI00300EBE3F
MENKTSVPTFRASDFLIKVGDFIRYLEAVGMRLECSQCGKDEGWSLDAGNDANDVTEVSIYKMPFSEGLAFRPVCAMTCNHCGFVRQVSARKVVAWVKDNPSGLL